MEIAGKVAVVSGGASGIGRASVLALAERGASVVIADLDEERSRQTVEMATARGGIAHFCRCDVTQSGDIEAVFETALERYGDSISRSTTPASAARTSSPTIRATGSA
jgi:15-hydroxyprostaglandin dehydrogenase (NAD)